MRQFVHQQLTTYLQRRTRRGVPWWVYGVSLAIANVVRQGILWQLDATTALQVTSFVVMVFGVVIAVDVIAALQRRRARRHPPSPSLCSQH